MPDLIDGVFGAPTESAVKAFQQTREIPVDGIVG
jgi:peptidoglycan hydrolase-like protein with peptidoglycan-binding domain